MIVAWILVAVEVVLMVVIVVLWRILTRQTRERLARSTYYLDDDDRWVFGIEPHARPASRP